MSWSPKEISLAIQTKKDPKTGQPLTQEQLLDLQKEAVSKGLTTGLTNGSDSKISVKFEPTDTVFAGSAQAGSAGDKIEISAKPRQEQKQAPKATEESYYTSLSTQKPQSIPRKDLCKYADKAGEKITTDSDGKQYLIRPDGKKYEILGFVEEEAGQDGIKWTNRGDATSRCQQGKTGVTCPDNAVTRYNEWLKEQQAQGKYLDAREATLEDVAVCNQDIFNSQGCKARGTSDDGVALIFAAANGKQADKLRIPILAKEENKPTPPQPDQGKQSGSVPDPNPATPTPPGESKQTPAGTTPVKYSNKEGGQSFVVGGNLFSENEVKALADKDGIIRLDQIAKQADKDGWVSIDTNGDGKPDEKINIKSITGRLQDPRGDYFKTGFSVLDEERQKL